MAVHRSGRDRSSVVGIAVAVAAAVSVLVSVSVALAGGARTGSVIGRSTPVEGGVLLALIVVGVRRARSARGAVGPVLAVAATGLLVLRYADAGEGLGTIVGVGVWTVVAIATVIVGMQLRSLDTRRTRAVADAQRDQRLHLARDLHDFVAHDVSEVLAQAQAGQVIAAGHEQCLGLFAKIEEAAQRSLRSMDQTVHLLHPASDDSWLGGGSRRDLSEIRALVARFADANGVHAEVRLDGFDDAELDAVPDAVSATLYRITVEALTNIRRHARDATTVEVALRRTAAGAGPAAIEVTVADDAPAATGAPSGQEARRSELGLATARERLEQIGGSLDAGPRRPRGWQLTAEAPLPAVRARAGR